MAKIKAFGKLVDRNEAFQIIINDKIGDICYARNTDTLENLLIYGWEALEDWTNKELEDFISELCIENQPQKPESKIRGKMH